MGASKVSIIRFHIVFGFVRYAENFEKTGKIKKDGAGKGL
jgi:hypothetical protein